MEKKYEKILAAFTRYIKEKCVYSEYKNKYLSYHRKNDSSSFLRFRRNFLNTVKGTSCYEMIIYDLSTNFPWKNKKDALTYGKLCIELGRILYLKKIGDCYNHRRNVDGVLTQLSNVANCTREIKKIKEEYGKLYNML